MKLSRTETFLDAMVNGTEVDITPQSRAEVYYQQLLEKMNGLSGGTEAGVTSWNDLEDKPFYVTEGVENAVFDEVVDISTTYDNVEYIGEYNELQTQILNSGSLYNVTIDGVEYNNIECYMDYIYAMLDSGMGEYYSKYPFCIYQDEAQLTIKLYQMNPGNHSIKISEVVSSGEVKQLDPKFVDAYTKEEIDNMFASLINGNEVEY